MLHSVMLRAADALLSLSYAIVLSAAFLTLSGCSLVDVDNVTCVIRDFEISCGIVPTTSQDLRANQLVAKDEKPDRPFARPLQRFEEDAP